MRQTGAIRRYRRTIIVAAGSMALVLGTLVNAGAGAA
jgi:hypothetical protein